MVMQGTSGSNTETYTQIYRPHNEFPFEVIMRNKRPRKNIRSVVIRLLFFVGIIFVMWLCESPSDENIDANLSPYPVYNGKIIIYPDYERICPLKVEASGINCYVRLHYLGEPYK